MNGPLHRSRKRLKCICLTPGCWFNPGRINQPLPIDHGQGGCPRCRSPIAGELVPRGGAQRRGRIAVRASTHRALGTITALPYAAVGRGPTIVGVPAITYPFRDIACRIMDPERVGVEETHLGRLTGVEAALAIEAVGILAADIASPPVLPAGAGAGHVFPLGFTR